MSAQHFAKALTAAEIAEARGALKGIVQYRRKNSFVDPWITMAAFDSLDVAERYANQSAKGSPWEYRWGRFPQGGDA